MATIDLTFGIDWQARATLTLVAEMFRWGHDPLTEVPFARIQSFVIHNGRESHVALVTTVGIGGPALMVSFGENRNSDALVVQVTPLDRAPFNAPTHEDLTDASYESRDGFRCGDIMSAATCVVGHLRAFIDAQVK